MKRTPRPIVNTPTQTMAERRAELDAAAALFHQREREWIASFPKTAPETGPPRLSGRAALDQLARITKARA